MSDSIKKLTDLFAKFPTVGKRTASRFVFHIINSSKQEIEQLVSALQELKNNITFCSFCFQPFEGKNALCSICENTARNQQILCIVEKEADLLSIENTQKYKGRYFILGGTLSLRNANGEHLRIKALQERVLHGNFTEIIIALNPTPEGRSTSVLVERALKETAQSPTFSITHLAKGLPVGGELEYADEETLESAFEGRK